MGGNGGDGSDDNVGNKSKKAEGIQYSDVIDPKSLLADNSNPQNQTIKLDLNAKIDIRALPPEMSDGAGFWLPGSGGEAMFKVHSGDRDRVYVADLPANFEPGKPVPVIIALQGGAGDGNMGDFSRLKEMANKEGFVVVYPQAIGAGAENSVQTWHGMYTDLLPSKDKKIDDGQFIGKDMMDDLRKRLNIQGKPFLYGFSNGGELATEIQFRNPQEFGGLASVAGPKSASQPENMRPGFDSGPVYFYYADKDLPYGKLDPASSEGLGRNVARSAIGSNYQDSYKDTIAYHIRTGGFIQDGEPELSKNKDLEVTHYRNHRGQEMRVVHYFGDYEGHTIPGSSANWDLPVLGEGSRIPENATRNILTMFKNELKREGY